jgi:hypothetical protein
MNMESKMENNRKKAIASFQCGCRDVFYVVEQKSDRFFGITQIKFGGRIFITHRESSRQACNIAKLLANTYQEGYMDGIY